MLIGSRGDFGHQEEEECEGRAKYRMMEVEEGKMVHLSSFCLVALSLLFLSYLLLPVHSVKTLEIIDKETLVSERFCAKRNC